MLKNYDHWKAYRDSDLFKELSEGYKEATGHTVMAITWYGYRHVTSNFPITKPEDMKGLKIRVPDSPVMVMFPNAVGANPTPMAFSEVYLALQQGVVDAEENPLPTIKFKKFYEVQKDINLTGHIGNSLHHHRVELARWPGSATTTRIVETVMKEAAAKCADEIHQSEKDLVQWFRDAGHPGERGRQGPRSRRREDADDDRIERALYAGACTTGCRRSRATCRAALGARLEQ